MAEVCQGPVVMAGPLAQTVAGKVRPHKWHEQDIRGDDRGIGPRFGNGAEAGRKIGPVGCMEDEWASACDAREGGAPAKRFRGLFEGGGIEFVPYGCIASKEAGRAEVGEGEGCKRCFEATANRRCQCAGEGSAGFAKGPAKRAAISRGCGACCGGCAFGIRVGQGFRLCWGVRPGERK